MLLRDVREKSAVIVQEMCILIVFLQYLFFVQYRPYLHCLSYHNAFAYSLVRSRISARCVENCHSRWCMLQCAPLSIPFSSSHSYDKQLLLLYFFFHVLPPNSFNAVYACALVCFSGIAKGLSAAFFLLTSDLTIHSLIL